MPDGPASADAARGGTPSADPEPPDEPRVPGRPGRPRRYSAEKERQLLLDAAFEVLNRNGYPEMTVSDILAEAKLSTRSFYRHFQSKDQMVCAMYRRDAERFTAALERRVGEATDPEAAFLVWFDEILGFGTGRPRARRAAAFAGPLTLHVQGIAEEAERARAALTGPLQRVLEAGRDAGAFPSARPRADARTVYSIAWDTSGQLARAGSDEQRQRLRAQALAFCFRALGAAPAAADRLDATDLRRQG